MKKKEKNSYKVLNSSIAYKPELYNLKLLYGITALFFITDYVMPQYFGFHLGYDFTCTRIGNVLIIIYFLLNYKLCTPFIESIFKCKLTIPIAMYLFVAAYTMVFRADVNALFLVFLEMLTLYMLMYLIRYVLGVKTALVWSIRCAYFFGIEGIIEFVYGKSIYHQFLSTMPNAVVNCYRSGHYRVMGPCGHSLGYGLLLILLIAIACIDIERDEIYLFKRPMLIVLLMLNVFLTGSRSTLGIMFLELFALFLFSNITNIKKTLLVAVLILLGGALFLLAFYNTGIGRYILMQLTSVIDQVFNTEYAANFGADVTTLKNSEEYRKVLPKIFELDWLNPIVGRGVKRSFGACIDGTYIISIDNYYIAQYIKYAYPGMISYIFFIITSCIFMIYNIFKYKSGLMKAILIAFVCYFVNLWWLDALQTLKYLYILLAIFYAYSVLLDEHVKKRVL